MQPPAAAVTRARTPLLIKRVSDPLDLMVLFQAISGVTQPLLAITSDPTTLARAVIL